MLINQSWFEIQVKLLDNPAAAICFLSAVILHFPFSLFQVMVFIGPEGYPVNIMLAQNTLIQSGMQFFQHLSTTRHLLLK
jgi:hypothetical protein